MTSYNVCYRSRTIIRNTVHTASGKETTVDFHLQPCIYGFSTNRNASQFWPLIFFSHNKKWINASTPSSANIIFVQVSLLLWWVLFCSRRVEKLHLRCAQIFNVFQQLSFNSLNTDWQTVWTNLEPGRMNSVLTGRECACVNFTLHDQFVWYLELQVTIPKN